MAIQHAFRCCDKEKPGSHSARPDVTIVQAYIQHPENVVKCLWPTYLIL